MKRTSAFSSLWTFLVITCSTISLLSLEVKSAGKCQSDQQSLLLQLQNSLVFEFEFDPLPWNRSTDCCSWEGVSCQEGLVVGLDLSGQSIIGGLTDNSSLFHFKYLKTLDLSTNNFGTPIPSRFGNLTNLRCLNLTQAGFVGKIPIEMSRLTNLANLKLSNNDELRVDLSTWSMIFKNITELEQLYLNGVDMSAMGKEWSRVFSSSLPNLRVLSLTSCSLSGPIHCSLLKLQSLSVLILDHNNLSALVPKFMANFSQLTSLDLSFCGLYGTFPKEIFKVATLETIDISDNPLLQVSLPEFSPNNSLGSLVLSNNKFPGRLPPSMGNLTRLSILDLSYCHFTRLSILDLSYCHFNGTLPNFMLPKLFWLDLSDNKFNGPNPVVSI